ncbi:uncharacterized protein LOC124841318 [Vigna umbellata]|uniref:uncharacterized protein LOC124841318 n=1 Tax=Vigna umbellata TaxID=87088 RepID=UPI001F5EE13F|nr:uncharacterized protein LOC124841318 [Vigna umbellata]
MGEKESVVEYIGRIQVVVNAMRACDKVVKDKKIMEKILRTLTPQYDHIVVAIEECKDLKNMRVEELHNSLEVSQGSNQALQTRSNYKPRGQGAGRGRGRSRGGRTRGRNANVCDQSVEEDYSEHRDGSKRGGKQTRGRRRKNIDKRNIQCYTRSKFRHYSSECWHNGAANKSKDDEANLAQDTYEFDSDHVLLMSIVDHDKEELRWSLSKNECEDEVHDLNRCKNDFLTQDKCQKVEHVLMSNNASHAIKDNCWYLDKGCSNHMTGKKEWLIDLDLNIRSSVMFADNSVIMAEGADKILVRHKEHIY